MSALLRKEIRLSSLPLTWLFISFGVMTLIPGYPILCSVFFITLGIYQSFQSAREANDILYSALLPVAKNDVVKGKYQFVMTFLKDTSPYRISDESEKNNSSTSEKQ